MKATFPQLEPSHLQEPATYFISDLHLSDQTPDITASFIAFLETVAPHADAIYILGDFLDAWLGDDTPADFFPEMAAACRRAREHTQLYFLQGNRDFLLSNKLLQQCHIQRIEDPSTIRIYNQPLVVCHGDHLCGQDYMHLLFRAVSQSRFFRWLFLSFPLSLRHKIAGQLRTEKHSKILRPPLVKFDATEGRVRRAFVKGRTQTLIHGHTHRPRHHDHTLADGRIGKRTVLGAWGSTTAVILRFDRSGKKELLDWQPRS